MKTAAYLCFSLISAQAAAPDYFVTREAGSAAQVSTPVALNQPPRAAGAAYDHNGVLYYALSGQIFRLNADGTDTPIAGSLSSSAKFAEAELALDAPLHIFDFKFDNSGNLYIADSTSMAIYKVSPDGTIHTFAGTGAFPIGVPGTGPNVPATAVPLSPFKLAIDSSGNVYALSDVSRAQVCDIVVSFPPDGSSSNLAASTPLLQGGFCGFGSTSLVAVDSKLFVNVAGQSFQASLPTGPLQSFGSIPVDLGEDASAAPNGMIYIFGTQGGLQEVDPVTFQVQPVPNAASVKGDSLAVNPVTGDAAVTSSGAVKVWTALTGKFQTAACNAPTFSGDGGPATLAVMSPQNLAADSAGDLFFTDQSHIREITPDGIVNTIAGTGVFGSTGGQGPALQAEIAPGAMAADGAGNLYFIDNDGAAPAAIRKIDRNGNLSAVLGGGKGKLLNGASPAAVSITSSSLAADLAGDLFFDNGDQLWELSNAGTITLLAGTGISGVVASGTPALSANIGSISTIAVNQSGTVYFGDSTHQVIYEIDPQGNLQILAGKFTLGGFHDMKSISAGPATGVNISEPDNLVVDPQGNLYFYGNLFHPPDEILRVDTSGNLTVITGLGSGGEGSDAANFSTGVAGLAMDASGNLYVSDGTFIDRLSPYDPANPPPYVAAGGIVGAGGSLPAVSAVSPGGEVSIFGANFVSAANAHTVTTADLVNGKVPTTLAGVCASFGGQPAAMLGVYPGQLNVQVGALTPGAVNVQVTANCGTAQAMTSNYSGVVVQAASPEFYSFKPDPLGGVNPIAAVNGLTGAFIGPPNLLPGAAFVAAKAGDAVQAYATGFGATNPSYGLGVLPGAIGTVTNPYSLTLGGIPIPPANISYAGISPCCAGFYQLDFTVPSGVPSGPQPLVITIAGQPSPPEAYIQVQ